jgi:hypothetical protein
VKRIAIFPVLVVATLLLASSGSATTSIKTASLQYLKDVAPADVALSSFDLEERAWNNATPDVEGEQQAAPVFRALGTLQRQLRSQAWPPSVKVGVQYIREDIASLLEDLSEIDDNSSLGNGTFQITFCADSRTLDSDAFYLRQALGLPNSPNL